MTAPPDVRRILSAARLMVSKNEGEASAAALAVCRLMGKAGLEPAAVIEAGLPREPERPSPREHETALLRNHQRTAMVCSAFPWLLNKWETAFLDGVRDARVLSERQEDTLRTIALKVERGRK